jgi:hypothetical protein
MGRGIPRNSIINELSAEQNNSTKIEDLNIDKFESPTDSFDYGKSSGLKDDDGETLRFKIPIRLKKAP